jgi:NAD(P)-dependent dehydrogenase (short-subunit alcohol dehydrogenase family)
MKDDAPQVIVKSALAAFGKIDGLVNNAAIFGGTNISDQSIEHFRAMIQVNLTAPLFLIKAAFEELKKSSGAVLNIGSINAYAGESKLLAYSISKGGMQTMTRNLANANGVHGVRVNQINPGWVLTEREYRDKVAVGLKPSWPQDLTRVDIPSGVMTTPEQMAEGAIYWLSDESKPFTGSVVDLEQFSIIGRNPEKLG